MLLVIMLLPPDKLYHTQRLIANSRPDRRQIDEMLEQLRDTPPIIRDRLKNMEIDKSLDVITAEAFDQVIEKLQQEQIRRERNRAKAKNKNKPR